jgi:hypothetical protein
MNTPCIQQGCKAAPQKSSEYCFFHDPSKAVERTEARTKGGANSRRYVAMPEAEAPKNAEEASELLGRVLAGLLRGEIDPRIANSAAYVCAQLAKSNEVAENKRQQTDAAEQISALDNLD